VLLFSGLTGRQDLLAMARAQGQEFDLLPKPVHPDALLSKIQFLIEHNSSLLAGRADLHACL